MTTAKPKTRTVSKTAPTAAPAKSATQPVTAGKKPAAKPAAKTVAPSVPKVVAKTAPVQQPKAKKPKMVRDSFTFPKLEYAVLDTLKLRAAKLGKPVKKTELLRAGLKAIAALSDTALLAALQAVPSLKTGRPAKAPSKA
jgi:hypothetical protein